MWKLRLVKARRLNHLLSISLAAGLGFVGLTLAQNDMHDQNQAVLEQKRDKDVKFKVGIIGSGIGGTSAAYFVRKALGSEVQIDVFEKENKVGGRISLVEIDNEFYESGASVIHESNKYLSDFCDVLGLGKIDKESDTFGIYNGTEFVFKSTGYGLIDKLKLLIRYGFDLIRMGRFTTKTLEKFKNIYNIQDSGQVFETVPELLFSLGGEDFIELTRESSKSALNKKGISKKIVNELATAVSRNNYGQDMGLNAFTGFVSLAGAQSGKLWAVKGGNNQICKGILKNAGINLMLNSKIDSISRNVNKNNKVKYSLTINRQPSGFVYDAVIIAVPLEVEQAFMQCTNCGSWPTFEELGRYQQTIATFVKGKLNHTVFGFIHSSAVPEVIFTTENPELDFSSFEVMKTVENKKNNDEGMFVYKVFSRKPFSKEQLDKYFSEYEIVTKVEWLAYPHYTPPEKFISFKLDDGIFYVNAIERAASAMEMSAIGGRNAALLALRHLKPTDESTEQHTKVEL